MCVRYAEDEPLFEQAGRRPVCLQLGRVYHQLFCLAVALRKLDEDAPEHAQFAPAHEAVVDCLVRPVAWRQIAPPQAVADDKDDAADHPTVIDPRDAMRERKERRYSRHLGFRE